MSQGEGPEPQLVFRDGNVPYSVKEKLSGIRSEWSLYLTQPARSRL